MLLYIHISIVWLQAHGILPPRGVQLDGFILAIWAVISVIISAVSKIATLVVDAGELIFHTVLDVASFAARGVVWLTATIRDGFAALFSAAKNLFGWVADSLKKLWSAVNDFYTKVRAFLQPYVDFLKKVQAIYDHYWNEFVKPVLDAISRVRKALGIFKYFGLQWASTLDGWLADIQQQIIKNTLWIQQQLTTIIGWVNSIGDPMGFLKYAPMLGGFVNGVDQFWQAIFGMKFFPTATSDGDRGTTKSALLEFQEQADEMRAKTGDAGQMYALAPGLRDALRSEMGVN